MTSLSQKISALDSRIDNINTSGGNTDTTAIQAQVDTNTSDISHLQIDKQDKLTEGTGISIDENNVISATGGGSGTTIDSTTDLSCNTLDTVGNITVGGNLTLNNQPRFMAYRTTDKTFISPTDVVYNVIKYNLGGGSYNTNTGAYTVQVAGLYMFSAVWHTVAGHTVEANIQKNGVIMSRCQLQTSLQNFTQNNVSFIECVEGDVINIYLAAGRVRIIYSSAFVVPQGYTQFTGIKIA